jgi:hypothetical protein
VAPGYHNTERSALDLASTTELGDSKLSERNVRAGEAYTV